MSNDDPKVILGDLETLRSLLVDEDEKSTSKSTGKKRKSDGTTDDLFAAQDDSLYPGRDDPGGDDTDVPVLEDVVDGAIEVDEGMLATHDQLESSDGVHILDDEAIKVLLSDDWQSAARGVLDGARQQIQESQSDWSPVDTDELNQALKVRIDATVSDWIRTTVVKHMGELRSQLLAAVQDEVTRQIEATLNQTELSDPTADPANDSTQDSPKKPTQKPTTEPTGNEDSG